jgi:hypothetical protein
VDYHIGVCYSLVCQDIRYVGQDYDEHGVRSFLTSFVIALAHPAKKNYQTPSSRFPELLDHS